MKVGLENGMPGWRNWQTRRTQNPVLAREWEFDPPSGHHRITGCRRFGKSLDMIMIGLCTKLNQIKLHITSVDMSKWVAYSLRS
jgi:hypothetical protein